MTVGTFDEPVANGAPASPTISILITDDHAIVRDGLAQFMATTPDIRVIGTAGTGAAAVAIYGDLQPDVVLMDLSMPEMNGIEATRQLRQKHPSCRILVLTSFSDQSRILEALAAGADGYLLKHADPETIAAGVRSVFIGESPLDPKAARVVLESQRRPAQPALTDREREVLVLVRDGLANKQIGRRLGIAERTVKAHLTSAFQRIGVSDRTQAALWVQTHLSDA